MATRRERDREARTDRRRGRNEEEDGGDEPSLERLVAFIRDRRGVDFSGYKQTSFRRRLHKRMSEAGVADPEEYVDLLQASPGEFQRLFDTLFINVTSFFRDPESWAALEEAVIPAVVQDEGEIRVWCAGVASGEEAYTMTMLLHQAMEPEEFRKRVKVFATDVDEAALRVAREGWYGRDALEDVPPHLMERYFEETETGRWRFASPARGALIFGQHNLMEDPPISNLSLLCCRNTLMYFEREAQSRIVERFHFALRRSGYLFLGRPEMLLTQRDLFRPAEWNHRIFRKERQGTAADASPERGPSRRSGGDEELLLAEALEVDAGAHLLLDADGRLVTANRTARSIFGIRSRDLGMLFRDLEVSYRPLELRSRIEKAHSRGATLRVEDVEHPAAPDALAFYDVRITPLTTTAGETLGTHVAFDDVTQRYELSREVVRSREELEQAYAELQSTNEELETTNEELHSTVEELETTNEELHSTNEELETMNAELQTTNEKIHRVNDDLRDRRKELDRVNGYFDQVLNSFPGAVVVLDRELRVTLWSDRAVALWGLSPGQVVGKPVHSLEIGLPVDELEETLERCLQAPAAPPSDPPVRRVDRTVKGHTRTGKDLRCHVTVVPLEGDGGRPEGVLLLVDAEREDARK